jgi:hypothetical protein
MLLSSKKFYLFPRPHHKQKRIYLELKRKELAEKQRKEEALRKKQAGE